RQPGRHRARREEVVPGRRGLATDGVRRPRGRRRRAVVGSAGRRRSGRRERGGRARGGEERGGVVGDGHRTQHPPGGGGGEGGEHPRAVARGGEVRERGGDVPGLARPEGGDRGGGPVRQAAQQRPPP